MASIATMTGPQFDALPYEEGRRWELIEGELVEVSSPTLEHQILLQRLLLALVLYAEGAILSTDLLPGFELPISKLFVI
jgi:Uma2 family endonuclease